MEDLRKGETFGTRPAERPLMGCLTMKPLAATAAIKGHKIGFAWLVGRPPSPTGFGLISLLPFFQGVELGGLPISMHTQMNRLPRHHLQTTLAIPCPRPAQGGLLF